MSEQTPQYFFRDHFLPAFAAYTGWEVEALDRESFQLWRIQTPRGWQFFSCGQLAAYHLNDAQAENLSKDKAYTNLLLTDAGLSVPQQLRLFSMNNFEQRFFSLWPQQPFAPKVSKPIAGMKGEFVRLASNLQVLKEQLATGLKAQKTGFVVEDFVEGREFRAVLLDGHCLFAYEKKPLPASQRAQGQVALNYAQGGGILRLHSPSATELSQLQRAAQTLGLRIVGADYKINERGLTFLELNGHPGLRALYEYAQSQDFSQNAAMNAQANQGLEIQGLALESLRRILLAKTDIYVPDQR